MASCLQVTNKRLVLLNPVSETIINNYLQKFIQTTKNMESQNKVIPEEPPSAAKE